MSAINPCLMCGACCALFRVGLDRCETDAYRVDGVPVQYTVGIDETRCAMRGTEGRKKRCEALQGRVGQAVSCAIYSRRPSCCRDFRGGWEKDIVNPICNRARATYGLPPFEDF
jgi:Fe-S-cluster containining protein